MNQQIGVEIELRDPKEFTIVRETLTRIGIPSFKAKSLTQTVHILYKQGKYYLVHFKEMFILDGLRSDITSEDIKRRNSIVRLLGQTWNLVKIVDEDQFNQSEFLNGPLFVLKHKDKEDWTLIKKYTMGKKERKYDER